MVVKASQERVKTLLKDTITLLCKNGLEFKDKFTLDALIGVTLDDKEVFLVSMHELVQSENAIRESAKADAAKVKSKSQSEGEESGSDSDLPRDQRQRKKHSKSDGYRQRHKRKHSDSENLPVKVKQEPGSPPPPPEPENEDLGDQFNPKAENPWGGGDPPSLSPSALGDIGTDMLTSEPPVKKQQTDSSDNGINEESRLSSARMQSDDDEEDDGDDIVFIKEESPDTLPSCSQQGQQQQMGQYSSDMSFMPIGSDHSDGSMLWTQVQQQQGAGRRRYHRGGSTSGSMSRQPHASASHHQQQPLHRQHSQGDMSVLQGDMSLQQGDMSLQQQGDMSMQQGGDGQQMTSAPQEFQQHLNIWKKRKMASCSTEMTYRYHCSHCNKGFHATNMLRGHMSWHTGIKEFKCKICPSEFRYKHDLKRHVAKKHKDIMEESGFMGDEYDSAGGLKTGSQPEASSLEAHINQYEQSIKVTNTE